MLERQRTRKQIIELLTDNINSVENIYDTPFRSINIDKLPYVAVFTPSENGNNRSIHLPNFETNLNIQLEVSIAMKSGYQDTLDDICEELENKLLRNPDFLREYNRIISYSTNTEINKEGEKPIVTAVINITAEYNNVLEQIHENLEEVEIYTHVDCIEPFDKNISETGPDGIIEAEI